MKYWIDDVDNVDRKERTKIVNWDGSGAEDYDDATAATVGTYVLATESTNTQAEWNQLYNHVTSGGTTNAFFIDNMYFAAGQARMSQRYARYAIDVIKGQAVGSSGGSAYRFAEWTNTYWA